MGSVATHFEVGIFLDAVISLIMQHPMTITWQHIMCVTVGIRTESEQILKQKIREYCRKFNVITK